MKAATFGARSTTEEVVADIDLHGKRVLMTGTSAGLGVETAKALVARRASVIGPVGNLGKGEQATTVVVAAAASAAGSSALV